MNFWFRQLSNHNILFSVYSQDVEEKTPHDYYDDGWRGTIDVWSSAWYTNAVIPVIKTCSVSICDRECVGITPAASALFSKVEQTRFRLRQSFPEHSILVHLRCRGVLSFTMVTNVPCFTHQVLSDWELVRAEILVSLKILKWHDKYNHDCMTSVLFSASFLAHFTSWTVHQVQSERITTIELLSVRLIAYGGDSVIWIRSIAANLLDICIDSPRDLWGSHSTSMRNVKIDLLAVRSPDLVAWTDFT